MPAAPSAIVQHAQAPQDVLFLTIIRFSRAITKNEQQKGHILSSKHSEARLSQTKGVPKHCPELAEAARQKPA
jgi:hypothetical protein